MKTKSGYVLAITAGIIFCLLCILPGCAAFPKGEGFAIYLTKENVPPSQMEALSHVDIATQPVIALSDITTYDAVTHEMVLNATAYDRIVNLIVPTNGKSFLVCVDKVPVYWGAFWVGFSSQSFDGVTIWKPLSPGEPKVIQLKLGYPSASFYGGEDPRNNTTVIQSLKQAGKLGTILTTTSTIPATIQSTTAATMLPHSMKGYELYSWQEYSKWHFTLITGTNRNKTLSEIIYGDNNITGDGWVNIHVTGTDEINNTLNRLPQNEYVCWLAMLWEDLTDPSGIKISLPEESTINIIKEHAKQCGLKLSVPTP